eukprot:TRINITY_DN2896_c0_g1_i1.p1 TRINITY_DN2896_c0_g1~~TRINITY_DN2896_c0_g1_i1.p1  ORF type:complete len:816 (+),score=159.39 TRINITY_DN2896_c0_g1_i1:2887-5334(+)
MAVGAMNNTAGPRGLVPTLLVFGALPRTPVASLPLPSQRDQMLAIIMASKEMTRLVAKERVRTALSAPVPAAAVRDVPVGSEVLVWREKPVYEWVGPFLAVSQLDKVVWLAVDGYLTQCSIDKVKPYQSSAMSPVPAASDAGGSHPPATTVCRTAPEAAASTTQPPTLPTDNVPSVDATPDSVDEPTTTDRAPWAAPPDELGDLLASVVSGEAFLSSVRRGCQACVERRPESPSARTPVRVTLPGSGAHALARGSAHETSANPLFAAHIAEVVPSGDPRLLTARFREAALEKVSGLRDRGKFTVAKTADVPRTASIIGGRFVYTLKNVGTAVELSKALFVGQGHRDRVKDFVVHNTATLRQRFTRLVVSTSANMGWRVYAQDITQAYLQSEDAFDRELYLRPKPADRHLFDLGDDEVLKLDLALYGVCDAGMYWAATLHGHIDKDLAMLPFISDPALYFKRFLDGVLSGMLGSYVDDTFHGGNQRFMSLTEATLVQFQGRPRMLDKVDFVGVHITTVPGSPRSFNIDQGAYIDRLKLLPDDASFFKFTSVRASLAWLTHTRPDLCCGANIAAQVTEDVYGPAAVKALIALIRRAQKGRDMVLTYRPLDRSTLRIHAYADASYANNMDGSLQLGYVILLCDGSRRAHVLSYASRKCRRVVHSIMAGEVYAFTAAFDEAYMLRFDLKVLYERRVHITLLTDSKQLFDVVTKASHPTEKRLLIDVAAARQAYNRHDLGTSTFYDYYPPFSGCGADCTALPDTVPEPDCPVLWSFPPDASLVPLPGPRCGCPDTAPFFHRDDCKHDRAPPLGPPQARQS